MLLILHKTRSTPPQKLSRQFNILTYLSLFILYLTLDTETLTRINKVIQQYLLSNYQGYLLFICLPSYLNFPTRPNYQKPLHFSFHWRYIWLSTRSSAYVSFLYIYIWIIKLWCSSYDMIVAGSPVQGTVKLILDYTSIPSCAHVTIHLISIINY